MTQVNGIDMNAQPAARYETPTFNPGVAFAWTLRSAEMARLERQRPRTLQPDRKTVVNQAHDAAASNGNRMHTDHAASYETATFDPGIAFSWTLRSAEIAGLERRRRSESAAASDQPNILAAV